MSFHCQIAGPAIWLTLIFRLYRIRDNLFRSFHYDFLSRNLVFPKKPAALQG